MCGHNHWQPSNCRRYNSSQRHCFQLDQCRSDLSHLSIPWRFPSHALQYVLGGFRVWMSIMYSCYVMLCTSFWTHSNFCLANRDPQRCWTYHGGSNMAETGTCCFNEDLNHGRSAKIYVSTCIRIARHAIFWAPTIMAVINKAGGNIVLIHQDVVKMIRLKYKLVDCFIMRMLNWQLVQCLLSCLAPLQCHSIIRVFFGCRLGSCEVVNVVHQPESNKHNLPPKLQQEDIAIFA